MKGFAYLRQLVRHPGVEVSSLELSNVAAGHAGLSVEDGAIGDVIDRQALAAYRTRLAEIDAELAEYRQWRDAGRPCRATRGRARRAAR